MLRRSVTQAPELSPAERDAQLRVRQLLQAGGPRTPARVRLLLGGYRSPRERRRQARMVPLGAIAVAAACALLAGVLLSGGGPPSPRQIAEAALSTPTGPAPGVKANDARLLSMRFADIDFPAYSEMIPAGTSTRTVSGRRVSTVLYDKPGRGGLISYSIVAGRPLRAPASTRTRKVGRTLIRAYRAGSLNYVVLVRAGHSCVLAGRVGTGTLLALATEPLIMSRPGATLVSWNRGRPTAVSPGTAYVSSPIGVRSAWRL